MCRLGHRPLALLPNLTGKEPPNMTPFTLSAPPITEPHPVGGAGCPQSWNRPCPPERPVCHPSPLATRTPTPAGGTLQGGGERRDALARYSPDARAARTVERGPLFRPPLSKGSVRRPGHETAGLAPRLAHFQSTVKALWVLVKRKMSPT